MFDPKPTRAQLLEKRQELLDEIDEIEEELWRTETLDDEPIRPTRVHHA